MIFLKALSESEEKLLFFLQLFCLSHGHVACHETQATKQAHVHMYKITHFQMIFFYIFTYLADKSGRDTNPKCDEKAKEIPKHESSFSEVFL